jgi:hypothetical protein
MNAKVLPPLPEIYVFYADEQMSRAEYAKSHTDGKSISSTDSGGEKTETPRNKTEYLAWNTKIFHIITYNVKTQTQD